jgi:hypothetical protein
MRLSVITAVFAAVVAGSVAVHAQTNAEPAGLYAGAGAGWIGGASLGDRPAELRAPSGGPYRLFNSETTLAGGGSFDARVGVALSRRWAVEGRAAIEKPEIRTVVSSDAETTGSFTLVESIDQYVFDGGVVIHLDGMRAMGLRPFVTGGAGYIRRLHEEQSLVEDGHLFYVGGGFTHALFARSQGFIRAASVRVDLRFNIVSLELDEGSHQQGSASGSFLLSF